MAVKTDNQVRLNDGKSMGYAEYGDPRGRPVLYFHGLPSLRLEMYNPDLIEIAERQHVRLIVTPTTSGSSLKTSSFPNGCASSACSVVPSMGEMQPAHPTSLPFWNASGFLANTAARSSSISIRISTTQKTATSGQEASIKNS